MVDHKVKCVGFGDGVSIENCNEDVKPFHDVCMAKNITFLEVLKNLDELQKMSASDLKNDRYDKFRRI